ncbi:winged helix-turn-helix transcriptional regulator [Propioniciclava flava]
MCVAVTTCTRRCALAGTCSACSRTSGAPLLSELRRVGRNALGDLRRRLEGVSPKVLSQTLKRLEEHALLSRTVYAEVPARVDYELTDLGHSAAEPLRHLRDWVEAHASRD